MKNYKITIQYDGTAYKGWQIQNNTEDTIQGKLTNILSRLCYADIDVIGSGRTDAGVHAKGQVANFHADIPSGMTESDLLLYINRYLPEDIAVTSLEEIDDRFHARFNAVRKTYSYRIHVSPIADAFNKRYVYNYSDCNLNIEAMKKAATLLEGQHDFKAFCGNRQMKKSTVRTIYSIDVNTIYDTVNPDILSEIRIDYTGDGFLQNMIRILTGTLIEVGSGQKSADSINSILESRDRANAGYTAPAQGLCLMSVEY